MIGLFAMAAAVAASPPLGVAVPKDYSELLLTRFPARPNGSTASGTTMFSVTVDPAGKDVRCEIARSSGSTDLDSATCAHVEGLLAFTPGRDSGGQPGWSVFTRGWAWTAGRPAQAPTHPADLTLLVARMPLDVDVIEVGANIAVSATGAIETCAPGSMAKVDGKPDPHADLLRPYEAAMCGEIKTRWHPVPARDAGGSAVASTQYVLVDFMPDKP